MVTTALAPMDLRADRVWLINMDYPYSLESATTFKVDIKLKDKTKAPMDFKAAFQKIRPAASKASFQHLDLEVERNVEFSLTLPRSLRQMWQSSVPW